VLLQGFFFGLFFSIINTFVEEYSPISKRSFGQIILIKSLLYVFAILVVIALALFVFFIFDLHRQIRWQELARTAPLLTRVSFLSYQLFFYTIHQLHTPGE
jgi:drug/metabolite transporter (DMT)-like permease